MASTHPFEAGEVVTYTDICVAEKAHLQAGMNYRLRGGHTIVLMSTRKNAPYADRIEDDGRTLIYEGHNVLSSLAKEPEKVDQPLQLPSGTLTANGKFFEAVRRYKEDNQPAELVRVYEKIRSSLWVYNGVFRLVDAWMEESNGRYVCKYRLEITETPEFNQGNEELEHTRMIPAHVKQEVWRRDKGKCVICGHTDNLHFDHIVPFSKGGSSLTAENIQLLCIRHNLAKSAKIV
jgi:hypothetical protein